MKFDARMLLVAVFCFMSGLLVADRIGTATAAPSQAPAQDHASFTGTNGAMSTGGNVIIVRDGKLWKIALTQGGDNNRLRPWAFLD